MRLLIVFLSILVFLSADSALATDTIKIIAVGDIMMGSSYPKKNLPPDDGLGIFDYVADELQGGDIVFGNLEGPLLDRGRPSKCGKSRGNNCFQFRTPKSFARHLRTAGFNALSIANNHSLDFGYEGVETTIITLYMNGIEPVGGKEVAVFDIKGKKIALAGFSFKGSRYAYPMGDIENAKKIVKELKNKYDLVIVSFHGGSEGNSATHVPDKQEFFLRENRGNVIRFSKSVIDAGADMVLGHGPHVLRAMEVYKEKLIVYSLGNFLTYGMFNVKGASGLSVILKAQLDMDSGHFIDGSLVAVRLSKKGIPEPDGSLEAVRLVERLFKTDTNGGGLLIEDIPEEKDGTFAKR